MKKRFTSIILSILMAIVCFLPLGTVNEQKASAYSSAYNGEDDTIYYFTDLYPSLDDDKLREEFGNEYTIVCDTQRMDSTKFNYMVNTQNYFRGFGENCVIILDFKTFKPNDSTLNTLFSYFKTGINENKGYKTGLITRFLQSSFSDLEMNYIDFSMFNADCSRIKGFFEASIDHYKANKSYTYADSAYFLDRSIVNLTSNYMTDLTTLVANNPFLKMFLDVLSNRLNCAYGLLSDEDVQVIVPISEGEFNFKDIISGRLYEFDTMEEVYGIYSDFPSNACAFGFSNLTTDFYNFLANDYEKGYISAIYVFEVDPIVYGENGLPIIGMTYQELKEYLYVDGVVDLTEEEEDLLSDLGSLLNY